MHISIHRAKLLLPLCTLALIAGCKRSSAPAAPAQTKSFPVVGVIINTDPAHNQVLLNHRAIPGFMEAMAMPYPLKDPGIIGELHAGDHITAQLLVDQVDGENHNPRLDQIVITSQARPDYKPAMQYNVPQPGDAVPDFKLTNQDALPIHLAQFKGDVVLLTFIYTRCPLPDYCIRMSRNLQQVDQLLAKDPVLYKHTHLITISFDSAFDTPAVLRAYGKPYTGGNFAHWDFADASPDQLKQMESFFDLGVTPGPDNTLNHSLSTVILDKTGKVAAFYHDNSWEPAKAFAVIQQAASQK